MIRKINGKRYLMRDTRPVRELRKLYAEYHVKFDSAISFERWLAERGKVHICLDKKGE